LGLGVLLRLYERHRPGAAKAGIIIGAIVSVRLLFMVWTPGSGDPSGALLDVGALSVLGMAAVWIAFFGSGWIALLAGSWLRSTAWRESRRHEDVAERAARAASADRIKRTEWTARLTLSLPAALFVMVTTLLWAAVWQAGGSRVQVPIPDTVLLRMF